MHGHEKIDEIHLTPICTSYYTADYRLCHVVFDVHKHMSKDTTTGLYLN